MDGSLSTLIAVLGTLTGVTLTYAFQRSETRRSRQFTAQQQLRSERMAVYSDFAGAVTEFRRGQHDRWHRLHEDPAGQAAFDARVEAHRLRGVALHALFRVELIASGSTRVTAAHHAYDLTSGIHRAGDATELNALGEQAREALQQFVRLAASDIH